MSTVWCANLLAHINKTKVGQKPTHPKGHRRLDHHLATFLSNSWGISLNECDFLCTTCYQLGKNSYDIANPVITATPMDIDESTSERAASRAALSNISSLSNAIIHIPDPEDSSSDSSDDESIELQSKLNRAKAMEFLNSVFAIVGQSPIRDIRNRNHLREKVDYAVRLIRQAAEELYKEKQEEEETFSNNTTEITIDESMEIVNNFKYLIHVSDYSEAIRLLTLTPKSWGRLKIKNFFSCSEHQARYSAYLRDEGQVLSLPIDLRGNIPFDPLVAKTIYDFFHVDEISRVFYQ